MKHHYQEHIKETEQKVSVYLPAMQSGTLGCHPGWLTVCLAPQTNSVQYVGNNYANVLVQFDLTGAIRIGHQVNSSRLIDTRLRALMHRDRSGEMCFCPAAAGLCALAEHH